MRYSKEKKAEIFEEFWKTYDKRIRKKACLAKWLKISSKNIDLIMKHVPLYVAATPDKEYRKHPKTYLNQETWHDEIISKKTKDRKGLNEKVQGKLSKYG